MMKYLIVILALLIGNFSVAQNRKELLKEIHTFEDKTYYSTLYQTTSAEMKLAVYTYFTQNKYKVSEEDSSSVTFVRITNLYYFKEYRKLAQHIVDVNVLTKNNLKTIEISDKTESYTEPFTNVEKIEIRGSYLFNKKELYSYLYHYFNKEKLILSTDLITKIETYNSQQKTDKKKIIIGRDY